MSIIGGTLTGPLIFMLPPLIYIRMLSLQSKHEEDLDKRIITNIDINVKTLKCEIPEVNKTENERTEKNVTINKLSQLKRFQNLEKGFCLFIILFFSILTISSTYLNLINAKQSYSNKRMPCIYNVTVELLYL